MNTQFMPETRRRASSPSTDVPKDAETASGFILKLYQMVNGAPDTVISWTTDGSAFIISDLKRLETETLPQFFRHNRFQSLVRQLNFYSFRKINRERHVWVYKHPLFNRGRPRDLALVRRRTCPGTDGRKQRLSRVPARKLNQIQGESTDDESEATKAVEIKAFEKTRSSETALESTSPPKRVSILGSASRIDDISALASSKNSAEKPVVEAETKGPVVLSKSETAYYSSVVSQVSLKLDEYARKARGTVGRSRRLDSGVVTPPLSAFYPSFRSLLTYDDEMDERLHSNTSIHSSSISMISDGDDSTMTNEEDSTLGVFKPSTLNVPPVEDANVVRSIVRLISHDDRPSAAIADFCMTTAPGDTTNLCSKILCLMEACESAAEDFYQYRLALNPCRLKTFPSIKQTWERDSSREDAVRDFRVFAVNVIDRIRGSAGCSSFTEEQQNMLDFTAAVWLKSMASA